MSGFVAILQNLEIFEKPTADVLRKSKIFLREISREIKNGMAF